MPSNKCFLSRNLLLFIPIFRKLLCEDGFVVLMKCLHFIDNYKYDEAPLEEKKLFKIFPLVKHLKMKFQTNNIPEREIYIDESLMKLKGRLSFKVYVPLKSSKFGVMLCGSNTSYVRDFFIYTCNTTSFDDDLMDEMF